MFGIYVALHSFLILLSRSTTARIDLKRGRTGASLAEPAVGAAPPEPSGEHPIKKGDKVKYKGAIATVVGIDYGLIPPSYALRKEDGNEVETERPYFSFLSRCGGADASARSAAPPSSKALAECIAEAEGLPAEHGANLCKTLGVDEAKKRIACVKSAHESLSATPGLEWDEARLHKEAAEICQSHGFDISQAKPIADCMSAALCKTSQGEPDGEEIPCIKPVGSSTLTKLADHLSQRSSLVEDVARFCNSTVPTQVAAKILRGDASPDPEVPGVRQNVSEHQRPKLVVRSDSALGISWELEKTPGRTNKPIVLSSPDEAVKKPGDAQSRDSGTPLTVPGTGSLLLLAIMGMLS